MAERIKGITVVIGGDTSGLKKSLGDVNKDISSMQKELTGVNRLLKLDPTNTGLLRQKQQLLNQEIATTKDKLTALKSAKATMDQQMANGTEVNQEQYRALTREIAATEQQLKALKREASSANLVLQEVSAVTKKISEGSDKVYQKTKLVSGAAIALGTAAVKASANLETELSNVQALSGSTAEEMDRLRAKAKEMGNKTKFSASEAAEAFSYMALAGWDTEQMLNGIDGIMNLAAASGEDLASVSDIVTDALTAFGLEAQDSAHFADVLAVAMSHSNTTVAGLGEAFKYVAPLAGTAGYSVEDVSVALGLMANSGIKGSQAGTTLRQALQNMVNPTKSQKEAMDALNLSLTNSDGSMKTLDEVIQMLRTEFAGLSVDLVDAEGNVREYEDIMADLEAQSVDTATAQKMALAASVFGARGLSGMLAIVNATEESYEGLKDSIYGTIDAETSAAEEMAKIQLDNFNGQLTLLKSALEGAAIAIGEKLTPFISKVVEKVQKAVDWFNSLSDEQVELAAKILLVIAAIAPLAKAISLVSGAISLLCANPVLLLIAAIVIAIVALTILIIKNWDKIKAALEAAWNTVVTVWNNIWAFLQGLWNTISSFAVGLWNSITGAISGAVSGAKSAIVSVWNSVTTWLSTTMQTIQTTVVSIWDRIKTGVTTKISNLKTSIVTGFNAAVTFIKNLPQQAVQWGRDLIQKFIDGLNQKLQDLKNKLKSIGDAIKNVIGFSEPKEGPLSNFHTFAPDMMELFAKGITDNLDLVRKAVSGVALTVGDIVPAEGMNAMNAQRSYTRSNVVNNSYGGVSIVVNGAAGQDVNELADIIMDKITVAVNRKEAVWA